MITPSSDGGVSAVFQSRIAKIEVLIHAIDQLIVFHLLYTETFLKNRFLSRAKAVGKLKIASCIVLIK
jgi:hypothetical protein